MSRTGHATVERRKELGLCIRCPMSAEQRPEPGRWQCARHLELQRSKARLARGTLAWLTKPALRRLLRGMDRRPIWRVAYESRQTV